MNDADLKAKNSAIVAEINAELLQRASFAKVRLTWDHHIAVELVEHTCTEHEARLFLAAVDRIFGSPTDAVSYSGHDPAKTCTNCGRGYTKGEWWSLPAVGKPLRTDDEFTDMRQCSCRGTMARCFCMRCQQEIRSDSHACPT